MEAEGANNWTNFMGHFKRSILESFEKHGIKGVHRLVTENLERWKHVPLNIAVTGSSRVEKSSFISTLNGTYADDEDGARVDVVQRTQEPTPYNHPTNENLIIWDLPEVGTTSFPQESYLQQVQFERYDCFIIISASRFTENEMWLANAIRSYIDDRKPFYFVRTKIDHDLSDYRRSHRDPEPQEETLKRIRSNIRSELVTGGFPNVPIFLIANYEIYQYDFGSLTNLLVLEAPAEKREAMALSLSVLMEEIINAKKEALRDRMWKICLASACGGAVPIPGFSAVVDCVLLLNEAILYREQFGLNEEELRSSARTLNIPFNDLKKELELESVGIVLTIRGLMTAFTGLAFSEYVESAAKFTIPIIGGGIAAATSFFSTRYILDKLLKSMVSDAEKINKRICHMLKENN